MGTRDVALVCASVRDCHPNGGCRAASLGDNLTRWPIGVNGSRRIFLRSSVYTVGPAVGLAQIPTIGTMTASCSKSSSGWIRMT